MVGRACTYRMPDGTACRATPLRDEPFCFWHTPGTADELAEARRMGGLHRRKKRTVATIYGCGGLRSIEDNQALLETIQALLETIAIETLALENSIARNRALAAIVPPGFHCSAVPTRAYQSDQTPLPPVRPARFAQVQPGPGPPTGRDR